ncbi:UNVERIFIED_CONTAM: Rrf2 family transcriptional regulator [Acinetobacter baumannii]|uniref:RrF2 family transcriptional regulator n=1 Tax=Acinetobacter baumannii TaxID=470 RepID=UPI0008199E24|nr:Rrf2 family transcriptional regulator [Acinetobacter baumannii]MCZ3027626.1 Rrf2 family transcriptional regulator [Acinetobacter baumannii]MDA3477112.1 Rrf2 family transcriptional regulator [Acinetobacter baumannii]MDQ8867773.1 Rrf2 family transcriptional regulator [Acinetobacter baumannii]MDQ9836247.1 Rrf2 family transcriptional regulator [Acinetobacter baumannii]MDQ9954879.1 Rrf2 family transcriptional regulator [Acinetobacter baumannii]
MQLNKFTDYALRILMYVARPSDAPYTIAEIAQDLYVSQNHLVKVVHFMGKQEWIITIRGKGGGIRLNPKALDLKLGTIVRILQGDHQIVECNTPPCVLRSHCGLKGILDQALESFYQSLDQYTLGEVLQQPKSASDHPPITFLQL